MDQTICPACGFSPIPEGAERCPECDEPFAVSPREAARGHWRPPDSEPITDVGGTLTSAVTAHPVQPALVIGAGAVAWLVRATGLLRVPAESPLVYAVALLGGLTVVVLLLNLGPVKRVAQLAMLVQLGFVGVFAGPELLQLRHLLFAAHALVAFSMVAGEPGNRRRDLSMGLGLGVAMLAVVFWYRGAPMQTTVRQELISTELGYRLLLPPGYVSRGSRSACGRR